MAPRVNYKSFDAQRVAYRTIFPGMDGATSVALESRGQPHNKFGRWSVSPLPAVGGGMMTSAAPVRASHAARHHDRERRLSRSASSGRKSGEGATSLIT